MAGDKSPPLKRSRRHPTRSANLSRRCDASLPSPARLATDDKPDLTVQAAVVRASTSGQGQVPPETRAPPSLLTVAEAARALRISQRQLRRLIAAGQVAVVRFGRAVRIARGEVERLAMEGLPAAARRKTDAP
jgi:excisionase family DNA binding protein